MGQVAAYALADRLWVLRVIVDSVCFSSFVSMAHYATDARCKRVEILFQLVGLGSFLMRIVAGNACHHTGCGVEMRRIFEVLRLLVVLFRGLAVRPETRFVEDITGKVFASKSEGRRLIQQNGLSLNDAKVTDVDYILQDSDFTDGEAIVKKGKKKYFKLVK